MLYLIYGSDSIEVNKKANSVVKNLLSKKPNANVFRLDAQNFNKEIVGESIKGRGLFESKYIIFLNEVFEDDDIREFLIDKISEMEKSENIFILAETKIEKETLKKIEKHVQKVQKINGDENNKRKDTKIFKLTNAIGARDRKKAWVEIQKVFRTGTYLPEEIHGMLFWQIKSIILTAESANADKAGIKPNVFRSAKSFSKNFSDGELKKLLSKLVSIYHEARTTNGLDLELALENFVLEI